MSNFWKINMVGLYDLYGIIYSLAVYASGDSGYQVFTFYCKKPIKSH